MPSLFGFTQSLFGKQWVSWPKLDSLRRVAWLPRPARLGLSQTVAASHEGALGKKMTPEEREKFREGMRVRCGPLSARSN